jgi:DsbC/DsbD-like thiol-disulfide interchange protein
MKLLYSLLTGWLLLPFSSYAQAARKGTFDKMIAGSIKALPCSAPDEQAPVTVNTALVKLPASGQMAVIIKARMAPGWHLYAYVPSDMPYIRTECLLELSPGVTAVGGWQKSRAIPSGTDRGVLLWEQEVVFVQRLRLGKNNKGRLRAGLSYQVCDLRQCLPPADKWFDLVF